MRNNTLSSDEILRNFFCLYNQDRDEKDKVNGIRDLDLASNPALANSLSEAGFEAEVKARLAEQELSAVPKTIDDTFDRSAKTTKTPPKIGPDEVGNAETRGHSLVEENGSSVIVNEPNEPTVELGLGDVFALGGNEDELSAIPTRPAAQFPTPPNQPPKLLEMQQVDFISSDPLASQPQSAPQQPPAVLLASSCPKEEGVKQKPPSPARTSFVRLVGLAALATAVVGSLLLCVVSLAHQYGYDQAMRQWVAYERNCGTEPQCVLSPVVSSLTLPPATITLTGHTPQKSQPVTRRPATVVRRPPSPRPRPSEVEVPAVMGTYPLPPAGDSRESVLTTLKRACGSDPRWIDANRSLLLGPAATTIRTACRLDIARRLPSFAPIKDYPVFTLKIRQG